MNSQSSSRIHGQEASTVTLAAATTLAALALGVWLGLRAPQGAFLSGLLLGWTAELFRWHAAVGPTFPLLATLVPTLWVWSLLHRSPQALSAAHEIAVALGTIGTVIGMMDAMSMLDGVSGVSGLAKLVPAFGNALVSTAVGLGMVVIGTLLGRFSGIDQEVSR